YNNEIYISEYTLNAVNNYGENLLHVSAAYGCCNIIKELLKKKENHQIINRKNNFGWTPLMQAIRNRNIDTVKLLLEQKSNVNDSTYLGMSVIGIASAINKEMLQLIYEICPSILKNAENDDITPLCIAALKNDKDMFFSLVDMGLDVSKANEYTHIMMKLSKIPEISNLAKHYYEIEDYWNDESDDIERENESSHDISICECISPYILKPQYESCKFQNDSMHSPNVMLKRLRSIRPADLDLTSVQNDHNTTLEIVLDYSPTSSPNVPEYINDENVSGDKTPTPPRYKTPPKGMILNSQQTKMIIFLKRYGLSHHMSIFLKEEVNIIYDTCYFLMI
ncbi:PREDICTED: ankyrin repeat and EF-hand domain-containing protein 1-like, partial [Polistes dominula]|uniref:Ankyrin repeat and EF-hand domain-containing protein 1-like n=1 Tax=Polistes dominula TaxID=743375 RepID=A0ABM1IMT5_POLDO